jgi:tetratricopeptide (TPR) repeat protein
MVDEDFGETLKKYQNNQAIDLNNIGNDYFKKGDYENAIRSYKTALDIDPNFIDTWNNLGVAYIKLGNIDEAKKCQEKVDLLKKTQEIEIPSKPISEINQQTPSKPLIKSDVDRRPFWLGLFGGIIGILVSLLGFVLTGLSALTNSSATMILLGLTIVTIIFSLIGMVSGISGKSKKSGILMIFCGIIILFTTYIVGILASIFFIVGGFIIYKNAE